MSEELAFAECDRLVREFEQVVKKPVKKRSSIYYTGVDLGTACVVLAVLDENRRPVAGAYRYADVVRDGMVVDYIGAIRLVREMKEELEEKLGTELIYAAAAIPPGTDALDGGAIKNVVQGAGFEITALLDEPTAANQILKIQNGAVVDKLPFSEAEIYKRDKKNHKEILPVLKPVIEKVASIISRQIEGYNVQGLYLVGGTCCLSGIEDIIGKKTGIPTYKPENHMFVTPLGIAMSCTDQEME